LRKIRCHYPEGDTFLQALDANQALQVFTTDGFEPGEEILLELSFPGLPGKMMVRAIGREWHPARPRLRVRAGGLVSCSGAEWGKLGFLRSVAGGDVQIDARRRHVRLPVLVELRWKRKDEREFQIGSLTEISEAGALLITQDAPLVGEELVLSIMPPGSARALEISAIVRNESSQGVGMEFQIRDMGGIHRVREVIRRLTAQ
jgi:Tfp pilus assembly protein PilZ